ncbi:MULTISPECIES: S1 family peptidase [Limnospira]|nr:serine protease [Arthrospira platensis]KDR55358.1 hypothetical protein APPUASWS_023695 [Arthrospira platensis str. Paraca]MBD2672023.1 trypsin-like peptidase domain-containing protein [Arthrospira platensis FACHB-439]MBD2713117.1 trypsin-like peptidase domain-containing protein [Arthrospira platensis FACHB-835]MDT9313278.1 serine protease [Limnospira sp. Paracas R14]BAI93515.1 hypothetical protein NIES39_O02660 [Arthrospira platensis NIES-39]
MGKKAREVTVMVDGCAAGSGMIYRRQGNTYYVLTAHHVVRNAQDTCLIITPDGIRHEANREVTVPQADVDLAVLTFTSENDYKLARWGNSDRVAVGQTVYVAGAPVATEAVPRRTVTISDGKVIGELPQPNEGYSLIYNNNTRPGMNGEPVFNDRGGVIGVHGRGDKTGRNLAIPIATFLERPQSAIAQGGQIVESPPQIQEAANLRGDFTLPALQQQGMIKRLGQGGVRQVIPLNQGGHCKWWGKFI